MLKLITCSKQVRIFLANQKTVVCRMPIVYKTMEYLKISGIILNILFCVNVNGFPFGAPEQFCIDHVPHHGASRQQTTPSPYVIEISPETYKPGDVITVRLYSPSGQTFKGYQIRAQQVGGDIEKFIGTFIQVSGDSQLQAWYPEDLSHRNCFTHTNNNDRSEIIATWQAPNISVGDIVFRGTLVKDFNTYWANIVSNVLRANDTQEIFYTPKQFAPVVPDRDFIEKCGETKGCTVYPKGCKTDCTQAIAYTANDEEQMILFEIYVQNAAAYVSLGFSDDKSMGEDSAVHCIASEDFTEIQYGYNPAKYTERHPINTTLFTDMAVERRGDAIYCSFKRSYRDHILKFDPQTRTPYYTSFDFTEEKYLQLAWGSVYYKSPNPAKHEALPLVSPDKIDLRKLEVTEFTQIPNEIKVHGSLGLTGWILFGSIGMLISRHYKPGMSKVIGKGFLKRTIWFSLHFASVTTCLILSCISVIVVFVYLEDWTENATVHAVFGLIAFGCGLSNFIAGLFRPDPKAELQPIFLWAHRVFAVTAFISAWVTVFLGANVSTIAESLQTDLTTVLIVWLIFVVLAELSLEIFTVVMSRKDNYEISNKAPTKVHPIKWVMFAGFLLISIGLYIAFIYVIAEA